MPVYTVRDIAQRLNVPRRWISDWLYLHPEWDGRCPVIAGRRLVPAEIAATLESQLRREWRLPQPATTATPVTA